MSGWYANYMEQQRREADEQLRAIEDRQSRCSQDPQWCATTIEEQQIQMLQDRQSGLMP
jgi:hypothetical protein